MELGNFLDLRAFWLAQPKDYATSTFYDEKTEI